MAKVCPFVAFVRLLAVLFSLSSGALNESGISAGSSIPRRVDGSSIILRVAHSLA